MMEVDVRITELLGIIIFMHESSIHTVRINHYTTKVTGGIKHEEIIVKYCRATHKLQMFQARYWYLYVCTGLAQSCTKLHILVLQSTTLV